MNKIIKEHTLTKGFRVVLIETGSEIPFEICTQQHWSTHADRPHDDHRYDGYRNCVCEWAVSKTEAVSMYEAMIQSQSRWYK